MQFAPWVFPLTEETASVPPRVREKVCAKRVVVPPARITPACAGKSAYLVRYACPYEDHPRVCGEKLISNTGSRIPMGSPPRVRGKVGLLLPLLTFVGITPACAGKSNWSHRFYSGSRDHPRVCGEKLAWAALRASAAGSPPRVRGKGLRSRLHMVCTGITPACAGKRITFHLKPV